MRGVGGGKGAQEYASGKPKRLPETTGTPPSGNQVWHFHAGLLSPARGRPQLVTEVSTVMKGEAWGITDRTRSRPGLLCPRPAPRKAQLGAIRCQSPGGPYPQKSHPRPQMSRRAADAFASSSSSHPLCVHLSLPLPPLGCVTALRGSRPATLSWPVACLALTGPMHTSCHVMRAGNCAMAPSLPGPVAGDLFN